MKRLILLALISLVVAAPAHAQFFKKGLFRKRVEQADSIPGMRSIYEVFNLVHSQYVTDIPFLESVQLFLYFYCL